MEVVRNRGKFASFRGEQLAGGQWLASEPTEYNESIRFEIFRYAESTTWLHHLADYLPAALYFVVFLYGG